MSDIDPEPPERAWNEMIARLEAKADDADRFELVPVWWCRTHDQQYDGAGVVIPPVDGADRCLAYGVERCEFVQLLAPKEGVNDDR